MDMWTAEEQNISVRSVRLLPMSERMKGKKKSTRFGSL